MINCGGVPKLAETLWNEGPEDSGWALPSTTRVYVVDCHRPYHHSNIHADTRITILDIEPGTDVPLEGDSDIESLDEESDEDKDGSDVVVSDADGGGGGDDDENYDDDDASSRRRRRRRAAAAAAGAGAAGTGEADDAATATPSRRKRLRRAAQGDDDTAATEESDAAGSESGDAAGRFTVAARRARYKDYYKGNYYSTPASFVMYELAEQVR